MEAATVCQQQRQEEGLAIDKMHEEKMIKDEKEFQEYAQQTIAKSKKPLQDVKPFRWNMLSELGAAAAEDQYMRL